MSLKIGDHTCTSPDVRVVALVPIHTVIVSAVSAMIAQKHLQRLAAGNARYSRPGSTKCDVVLSVKEIGCVSRIQLHRLKAVMLVQHSTGPLPNTAQVRLAAELIALLGYRDRMPVLETHVGPFKIDEEVVRNRAVTIDCARVAI